MMLQVYGSKLTGGTNTRFRNRKNFHRQNARSNYDEVTPLVSLCEGEKGVIIKALGGFGLVRRLTDMGLTPGVEVRLLRKCPFRGPVQLEVRGATLALGYGVASKVFVKPVKAQANG
jgi:Fe2+ transport system protein FeoA